MNRTLRTWCRKASCGRTGNWRKFDERASFGTWLYRIAMNCSLDLVRSRKRRNEQVAPADPEMDDPMLSLPSHDPTPDRIAMSGQVRDRVAEAMNDLSAFGADRICAAALRRHVYRRCEPRPGLPAGRGQAQRISRRAEIEKGSGALGECGKMNHLNEEQLILHYYGERRRLPTIPSPPSSISKNAANAGRSTPRCSGC